LSQAFDAWLLRFDEGVLRRYYDLREVILGY